MVYILLNKTKGLSIKLDGENAFTLLEVTIAFTIIVIIIFGIYGTILHIQKTSKYNRETQLATFASQREMELLSAEEWSNLPTKNNQAIYVDGLDFPEGKSDNGVIKVDSTFIDQDILSVQIIIYWKSFGRTRKIAIKTFIEKK